MAKIRNRNTAAHALWVQRKAQRNRETIAARSERDRTLYLPDGTRRQGFVTLAMRQAFR